MNAIEKYFSGLYARYANAHGSEWQITYDDYLQWWLSSGKAEQRFADPRSVRFRRVDKSKPWTLGNLEFAYPEDKEAVAKAKRFRRTNPNSKLPKVLTKEQWLEEIRHK